MFSLLVAKYNAKNSDFSDFLEDQRNKHATQSVNTELFVVFQKEKSYFTIGL
jgi:hypothetical protein